MNNKKVTAGAFSVFHTGPREYTVVNNHTGATCSYHPTLSQAFSAAQRRQAIEVEATTNI